MSPEPAAGDRPLGRRTVRSGSPYEDLIGFSRALRVGGLVTVSGTVDWSFAEDAQTQARNALRTVVTALAELGATPEDVVRTRMYLVDPQDADAVGRAHAEVFEHVRPAASMVVVAALLDPRWRVEIEADAFVGSVSGGP